MLSLLVDEGKLNSFTIMIRIFLIDALDKFFDVG